MRVVLYDGPAETRARFHPLSLSRPVWELRCGMRSIGDKLLEKVGAADVACFVPDYMAAACRQRTEHKVNDPTTLAGDDLLVVHGRVKAEGFNVAAAGPSEVHVADDGEVLAARIAEQDLGKLGGPKDVESLLAAAKAKLPNVPSKLDTWDYTWDLVLANPEVLVADFKAAGRSGIEGTVEQPNAIRGSGKDVYVAGGATVHPMVVIDAEHGPVYIDADAEVYPFTRIEGPCYVGPRSMLLGAKCREGMSIGPVCRVGGEVEESIIHGYSNKYHDGFLGHAYVGEWVNLGALTANSDLKNDYSSVSVTLDGRNAIDTGSTKVGSLIGDHTKTSIGTLFNTGAYVGAMALILATGTPLPKFIPSFSWFLGGAVTKGFGKGKLYETAKVAMGRRKRQWTEADQSMWDAVFDLTAPARTEAIRRGRRGKR
ncbi:MAG TPA: putative sugar nucleotidyl transferase [Phycisphaerae bacterium]|nr:putative sugar nucleotidyl transferase [Phycisphaerae bacterium]